MGIKVDIGSADTQGSTASSVLSNRVSYYDSVITALENFVGEGELAGVAYDSGKSYAESLLVPLVRGAILLSEGLGSKASNLSYLYHSQVGGESLDEDVLMKQIETQNNSISIQQSIIRSLSGLKDIDPVYVRNAQSVISQASSKRQELQEKLEKLRSFASSTSSHFSEVESLQTSVHQGLEQVSSDFGSFSGSFSVGAQPAWAVNLNQAWDERTEIVQNYNEALERFDKKGDLTGEDIQAIAKYSNRYGEDKIPKRILEYITNKSAGRIDNSNIIEFFNTVVAATAEELSKYNIENIRVDKPSLEDYFKYFAIKDKFGNTHFKTYVNATGYADDIAKYTTTKFLKGMTVAEIDVPIPGTNSSVGISGISSVFMGLDFVNNLEDENVGRAFMHTATTTAMSSVGVGALSAGVTYVGATGIFGSYGIAAASFIAAHPVGWAIAAGIGIGWVVSKAYDYNFLGIKDMANTMGDNLNKDIQAVGQSFDSGIKSIQKVFGW